MKTTPLAFALAFVVQQALAQTHMTHEQMPMHTGGASAAGAHQKGMFGPYAMTREASGTSWQPDGTPFMHRFSGMDNPEAPLTHHWLDSTHITFGVLTAGYAWRTFKLEASAFNGREPDEHRWNIETRKFDSSSARLSWNPAPQWSLQISRGRLDSPELLEPDVALRRTTASASYQHALASGPMQTTLAWGRNRKDPGATTDGYLLESALHIRRDTSLFGRFERVENDELFRDDEPLHGQVFKVRKLSVGFVRDFFSAGKVKFGAGALVSKYWAPAVLDSIYGASPSGYMLFFRARIASD
ncbi:MAG: hypothetical protein Q8R69_23530 [Telluria sp.]|nr:hypothetical protein [Telluria sp.]